MTTPTSSTPTEREPRTEAGRTLLYDPDEGYPAGLEEAMGRDATRWRDSLRAHILAIEREAAGVATETGGLQQAALVEANNRWQNETRTHAIRRHSFIEGAMWAARLSVHPDREDAP